MKEWIETDEVNVLQHANADAPCLSIRSYESADVRDCGKIIGLEHVVRPPYPTLPQDVNLQSGEDERKNFQKHAPLTNKVQKKRFLNHAPRLRVLQYLLQHPLNTFQKLLFMVKIEMSILLVNEIF